jgi:predicted transcriptional regulator
MTLKEIQNLLEADIIWGSEEQLLIEIENAGASDLMSDALAMGEAGILFLTGLASPQSVRTADIIEAKAIVYVRGKKPDQEGLELAVQKEIPILSTKFMMYKACGILYMHGLRGVHENRESQ